MAALAADMKQLRSFLHVSTAYVNCFLGRQKHVEERQYELMHNGKPMCHAAVIEELQSLAPDQAEKRVSAAWPEHLIAVRARHPSLWSQKWPASCGKRQNTLMCKTGPWLSATGCKSPL